MRHQLIKMVRKVSNTQRRVATRIATASICCKGHCARISGSLR